MDKKPQKTHKLFPLLRQTTQTNEGFSLLELVVAVGIILILTVSGLVSYNKLINNARESQVNNTASDLFMLSATHRASGKSKAFTTESLQQWAQANEMEFEKVDVGTCEIYSDTINGEYLKVEFTIDQRNNIRVYVENTANGYNVQRQEPNFDATCD